MADGGDGLVRAGKVPDHFEHSLVQPDVLRGATAGNDEPVVILFADIVERGVEREVVAALLAVRLVAFKIVDRGAHNIARALLRTDGVHRVAHHQQRLERHHHFVIFDVIADQHQEFLWQPYSIPILTGPPLARLATNAGVDGYR